VNAIAVSRGGIQATKRAGTGHFQQRQHPATELTTMPALLVTALTPNFRAI
jgi:hypothetical protein